VSINTSGELRHDFSVTVQFNYLPCFKFQGHDTTAVGMSWAMYLIGSHPEVQVLFIIFGIGKLSFFLYNILCNFWASHVFVLSQMNCVYQEPERIIERCKARF
jgi:hypothetical protein